MKSAIFARHDEIALLESLCTSQKAEFLAVYGRRRVGKTFLIKEFFKNQQDALFFKITGLKKGLMHEQIENFITQVGEVFYKGASLSIPKNWNQAFAVLTKAIGAVAENKKVILFFDELPWLATRNSRLMESLGYHWNQHWSDDSRIKLIVCGSSSSWIVRKIINDRGGLHNRITRKIHLSPFTLKETEEFLKQNRVTLNRTQLLMLYMAIGGIPYYLTFVDKGLSSSQIIEKLAFSQNGFFLEEFDNLFSSLFDEPNDYVAILRIIAHTQYGISQETLLSKLDKSLQGQRGLDMLNELEEADFIMRFKPHFHKRRGVYYRVIDEYTLFYMKWIEPIKETLQERALAEGNWQEVQHSSEWHAWSGYAFETVCYKHITQIRKALGISPTAIADSWRYVPKNKEDNQGAQIDLLFDRRDDVITLCEIKYSDKPFTLTKDYVAVLLRKMDVLKKQTGTTKQLFWSLISAHGIKDNFYADDMINGVVTLDDLFS